MRAPRFLLAACLFLSVAESSAFAASPAKKIGPFALDDHLGTRHTSDEWNEKPALVVVFLGTECPLARLYGPRIQELSKRYREQGVQFIGINSNQQDSLAEITSDARRHQFDFPILKDPGNKVADQFGATRTPEVFLLDRDRAVRYHGRIDDQYGVGHARPEPTERYLRSAIDALLAGREIKTTETKLVGCLIGRAPRREPTGDVTYSNQITRILQKRCVECHRDGQVAPFALTSYSEVAGWAEMIREVVQDRRMPPWHANSEHGKFTNDTRMPDDEKELLSKWIDNGLPEGDRSQLPPTVAYAEGWRIPKPDAIYKMPEPFRVPAQGTVDYKVFTVDPGFTKDMWIRAAEGKPGNRQVVHHLVLFYLPPGQDEPKPIDPLINTVAGFAPGSPALTAPDGYARRIPAGSKLVFQMHYTPNGTEQTDQSEAGLIFVDEKTVQKELKIGATLNFRFRIPPGADNYLVESQQRMGKDMLIYALIPHMHLRGKSFQFDAVFADQRKETLLEVPRYDFNWQNTYVLAEPKLLPEGTELKCKAHFDNSENNLMNPNPHEAVSFGEQTWEEMMIGMYYYSDAEQDLSLGPPVVKPVGNDRYDVAFRYKPKAKADAVYLAGEFNGWKPAGHRMDGPNADGFYTTSVQLGKGKHEYKFVVNGKNWKQDPGNREEVGLYNNSLVRVGL